MVLALLGLGLLVSANYDVSPANREFEFMISTLYALEGHLESLDNRIYAEDKELECDRQVFVENSGVDRRELLDARLRFPERVLELQKATTFFNSLILRAMRMELTSTQWLDEKFPVLTITEVLKLGIDNTELTSEDQIRSFHAAVLEFRKEALPKTRARAELQKHWEPWITSRPKVQAVLFLLDKDLFIETYVERIGAIDSPSQTEDFCKSLREKP